MGNKLQRMLNPTEEDKEKRLIQFLEWKLDDVKQKACTTCKHCKFIKTYHHSYETVDSYCVLKDKLLPKTCDQYEVKALEDLFNYDYID